MKTDKKAGFDKRLILLIALSLLTAFGFMGKRGLYETSEGRYAECAREMVESGNYLEPTLGYRPHWTKPPVTYWAIAAGIQVFSGSEWGVRFFLATGFLLTVAVVFLTGRLLWGASAGYAAAMVYATSPLPVFGAFSVTTDTLLALFETTAVFCYLKARFGDSATNRRNWIAGMWLCFGFGFLTKGPPALMPLAPILLWHFASGRPFGFFPLLGLVIFSVTALSWYMIVWMRHPDLLDYFIGVEVYGRLTSDSGHNSEWYKPFTLYLPLLFLGTGPWIFVVAKTLWIRGRRGLASFRDRLVFGAPEAFLVLWIAIPFVIFCLVRSRLPLYLLPLMAPMALGIARCLTADDASARMPLVRTVAVAMAVVIFAAKGIAAVVPNANNMKQLYERVRQATEGEAQVRLYCPQLLYGLQYYMDGRLKRMSSSGKEPWADEGFGDFFRSIKGDKNPRPVVFVASKESHPALKRAFSELKIPFRRMPGKFWILYRIEKGKNATENQVR